MSDEQNNLGNKLSKRQIFIALGGVLFIIFLLWFGISQSRNNISQIAESSKPPIVTNNNPSLDRQKQIEKEENERKLAKEQEEKDNIANDPTKYLINILKKSSGRRSEDDVTSFSQAEGFDTAVTVQYNNSIVSIRWPLDCFYNKPLTLLQDTDSPSYRADELLNSVVMVLSALCNAKILDHISIDKIKLEMWAPNSYEDKWGETKWKRPFSILNASYSFSNIDKLFKQWNTGKEVNIKKIADNWSWDLRQH